MKPSMKITMFTLAVTMLATSVTGAMAQTAWDREHPRRDVVTVCNIFLGWTLIGWFLVFLWAALGRVEEQPA